jgi:hypothetical protein
MRTAMGTWATQGRLLRCGRGNLGSVQASKAALAVLALLTKHDDMDWRCIPMQSKVLVVL